MAPQVPNITVLGSLNMDVVSYVSHMPSAGETLASNSFALSPGGKGANQAIACAKLSRSKSSYTTQQSAHIRMLGAVGADAYGKQLTTNLTTHGVDCTGITVSPDQQTGVAVIIVEEPTGQNRIIFSAQANNSLQASQFTVLHDPKPDLLIMQLETPLPVVLAAMKAALNASVPVLLNPAPAQPLPDEAYTGLAHLVVNETEAAILSGLQETDLEADSGLENAGAIFLKRGVQNVIVTLGGRGVYYASAKDNKKGLVPAEKAKVVDTTAAGDTFVGRYALEAVTDAFDIEAAVRLANRAAAKTVERMGAQDSIPWRDEL